MSVGFPYEEGVAEAWIARRGALADELVARARLAPTPARSYLRRNPVWRSMMDASPIGLLDILKLVLVAGIFWWLVGGWSSIRRPQVFLPLLVGIACVALAAWASTGIDAVRAGEVRALSASGFSNLAFGGMIVAAIAVGWAAFAGYRLRQQRIGARAP